MSVSGANRFVIRESQGIFLLVEPGTMGYRQGGESQISLVLFGLYNNTLWSHQFTPLCDSKRLSSKSMLNSIMKQLLVKLVKLGQGNIIVCEKMPSPSTGGMMILLDI